MSRRSRRGFATGFSRRYKAATIEEGKLRAALTPKEQTGANLKTLADMNDEEKAALEQQYGMRIKR